MTAPAILHREIDPKADLLAACTLARKAIATLVPEAEHTLAYLDAAIARARPTPTPMED